MSNQNDNEKRTPDGRPRDNGPERKASPDRKTSPDRQGSDLQRIEREREQRGPR